MNAPDTQPLFTLRNLTFSLLWLAGVIGAVILATSVSLGTQIKALLGVPHLSLPIELAVRRGHMVTPPIHWMGAIGGLVLTLLAMALVLMLARNEDSKA